MMCRLCRHYTHYILLFVCFCKPRAFLWDSSWSSPASLRLGNKQHDLIFNFLSPFVVLTLVIKTCQDLFFGWGERIDKLSKAASCEAHTHNDQAPLSSCTYDGSYLYLLVLKPEWRVLTCFNYILTLTVLVSETCPRRLWAIGWLRTASPQVAHFEPEGNCLNDPPVLETYIEETQEVGDTRWRPCSCGILLLSICIDDSAAYSM